MNAPPTDLALQPPIVARLGLVFRERRTTSDTGDVAEAFVKAAMLRVGLRVLMVDQASSRYDMLLEQPGGFLRVQVKSGRLVKGAVVFNACSISRNKGERRVPYTAADIDMFAVFCEELMTVYLVPVGEVSACGVGSLRVEKAKNGQSANIRYAEDYELCCVGAAA